MNAYSVTAIGSMPVKTIAKAIAKSAIQSSVKRGARFVSCLATGSNGGGFESTKA